MKVCACQKRSYHKYWHSFKHPTQKIYLQFLENIAQTWKRAEKWIQDIKPGHLCQYSKCTKLHKHKLIQGRHSLRNAAPKCSLRSPMSRNVCFKHVQHPMKSVFQTLIITAPKHPMKFFLSNCRVTYFIQWESCFHLHKQFLHK